MLTFPSGFAWGTATAAHQVEGSNFNNQWWEWEGRPGRIRDATRSHPGPNQLRYYPEDFALYQSLNQNAHRLSIEWSRVVPAPGIVDRGAVRHYREVLETLKDRGIEPFVTLLHFTHPLWFDRRGGWTKRDNLAPFLDFVRIVVREYGDLVQHWITVNEPSVYAFMGFVDGSHPPGRHDLPLALRVLGNLLRAHGAAYDVIHEIQPDSEVGIALNLAAVEPYRPGHQLDRIVAAAQQRAMGRGVIAALGDGRPLLMAAGALLPARPLKRVDALGLNYYTRSRVRFAPNPSNLFGEQRIDPDVTRTLFGWEIYPTGIRRTLQLFGAYHLPVYVTENGCAAEDDSMRARYLTDHLAEVHRAIESGVDVRGYFHWSSLDNFEWAEGLRMRFGLIHVDFESGERTVKPSGSLYARICATNGLTDRGDDVPMLGATVPN